MTKEIGCISSVAVPDIVLAILTSIPRVMGVAHVLLDVIDVFAI
jgi:hypothetical protein